MSPASFRLLCLLLSCIVSANLAFAQDSEPFGVVLYAEGAEITIFRDGDIYTYGANSSEVFGLPVFQGDLVQTDRGTFLEMQLMPTRTIIKVAENTSFLIEELSTDGANSFNILYGRVRAQVDRIGPGSDFSIRGRTVVAGVRGTDFGYDYVVERGSFTDPVTLVYCFEGSVELVEVEDSEPAFFAEEDSGEEVSSQAATPSPESLLIVANQMVSVRASAESDATVQTAGLRQEVLSESVRQYWTDNEINSQAVDIEEIDRQFPNLKVRILEAKAAARIAAERKALQAGLLSEDQYFQTLESLKLPNPSFADTLAALEPVSASSILPGRMPQVYETNAGRIMGLVLSGAGALSAAGAASVMLWGEQVYGMNPADTAGVSLGMLIGALGALAIGLPLYFANF